MIMGRFIEVKPCMFVKKVTNKDRAGLVDVITSDTGMDFTDVVLATGSLANVSPMTRQTFRTMLCLSTFEVYPVDA